MKDNSTNKQFATLTGVCNGSISVVDGKIQEKQPEGALVSSETTGVFIYTATCDQDKGKQLEVYQSHAI